MRGSPKVYCGVKVIGVTVERIIHHMTRWDGGKVKGILGTDGKKMVGMKIVKILL